MKAVAAVIVSLVALLALTWVIQGNNFFMYKYFAPKEEQVRRETFEQSKAYRQGMIQELENMQFQYIKALSDEKAALADIILHRAADFPEEDMPADLREFIRELKRERNLSR